MSIERLDPLRQGLVRLPRHNRIVAPAKFYAQPPRTIARNDRHPRLRAGIRRSRMPDPAVHHQRTALRADDLDLTANRLELIDPLS